MMPSLPAQSPIRFRLTEIFAALFLQQIAAFAYAGLMHARTSTDAFSRAFSAPMARSANARDGNDQHVAKAWMAGRLLLVLLLALFFALLLATAWATAAQAAPPVLYHSANDDGVAAPGIPHSCGTERP